MPRGLGDSLLPFLFVGRLDTGGFAGKATHVVDAGAADFAAADHFDLGNRGGIDREGPFDPDPVGDLADDEGLADPMAPALDDDAFEDLDSFLLVFDDADRNPHGVPAGKVGEVMTDLAFGDFIDDVAVHVCTPN